MLILGGLIVAGCIGYLVGGWSRRHQVRRLENQLERKVAAIRFYQDIAKVWRQRYMRIRG